MLQEENYSGKKLIVGDLEVIGNMTGSGITEIKRSVDTLQNSVESAHAAQSEYWGALSSDGFISPVEKKQLRKEWDSIVQVHSAVMAKAQSKGMAGTDEVKAYHEAYETLDTYLNTTLKLFESMGESTAIENKQTFNNYFTQYYFTLENAQSRINVGDPGRIRVLSSLEEIGTDQEVAIYDNQFYVYDLATHTWYGLQVASKVGEYQGVVTSSPPQIQNQYFLVGPEGIPADFLEFILEDDTHQEWVDQDGELIYINVGFEIGFIYYWDEELNEFVKVTDKNNWRYVMAMNDMLACGYDVSPSLHEFLYGTIAGQISEEIVDETVARVPKYLGPKDYLPDDAVDHDWITWAGSTSGNFKKGHVYIFQFATRLWVELDPEDGTWNTNDMLMRALKDILKYNNAKDGYFAELFCNVLFTNQATINELKAINIELSDEGWIRSNGFVSGQKGWRIQGKSETGTGDYSAEFANVKIRGQVHATSGEFDGDIKADDLIIKCEPGNVILSEQSTSTYETEITKSYIVPCKGSLRCFISFPSGILASDQTSDTYIRVLVNGVEKSRVNGPSLVSKAYFDVTVNPNDRITLAFKVNAYDHSGARPAVITYTYYFGIGSSKNQNLLKFLIEARNRTLFG